MAKRFKRLTFRTLRASFLSRVSRSSKAMTLGFHQSVSGFWLAAMVVSVSTAAAAATNQIQIHFNRDVRPILSENCFVCHGHDKNNRQAKLRLDLREVALERGAIVPGKPDES